MTDTSFLCLDRVVPLELSSLAEDHAVGARSDNERGVLEAAGEHYRFWPVGMVLRVRFLDSPELAPRVMAAAAAWTEHANLFFEVVPDGPAEIRVTFQENGNWSAVGTDALLAEYFGADGPTMCLSEITAPESAARVDRIARHEFGHAIGLVHEHSSPAAGIDWNKPAVYAALGGPPNNWTKEAVDHNVFRRYDLRTTNYTEFDPESIMLYALPDGWTNGGSRFREASVLSATDIEFVRGIYPGHP